MPIDMFLKCTDLPGESVDNTYAGSIDVLAWSWGLSQSGTTHAGPGAGAGKVNVQDLSLTKYVDKSSPKLFQACAAGTHFPTANIFVRKSGDKPLEYYKIELKDLIVSSVQNSGSSGGDSVMESITMNTAVINFTYVEQDAKGGAGKTVTAGFDVRQAQKV